MLSVIIILINWLGHVFICSVYKCYKLDDWWFLSVTGTLTGYSPCHNATEAGGQAALITKAGRANQSFCKTSFGYLARQLFGKY